ncbi:hypothetical protein [Brucella intermedia]|uniref:Uncharacterized protein n=1 Tax=Brucella intermedia M86 TaxID=1234597 RepID=M5JSJ8_9HYPH|nr:hypothetical protein [Brucella intermedia]ELT50973.1 hypothetical protein D584_01228 [Brucella intermedia M86]
MRNAPLEPQMREWLIRLFDAFAAHTGLTIGSISVRICGGDAQFYDGLKGGHKTFSAYSFDRTLASLSDAWPPELEWPSDIPRFGRSSVRFKTRAPRMNSHANAAE